MPYSLSCHPVTPCAVPRHQSKYRLAVSASFSSHSGLCMYRGDDAIAMHKLTSNSYRQLRITPPPSQNLQPTLDIRPDNRDVTGKLADGNQEIPEENEKPIQLDQEAREWPADEDEDDSGGESGSPFELLGAREEDYCLLEADDEGESN